MSDWHKQETYKALAQIGNNALKFTLLSNGGATVAILALVGAQSGREFGNVYWPLSCFLGGVFLGGMAHVSAYLTQLALHQENVGQEVSFQHTFWLRVTVGLVGLSVILFGFGSILGVSAFGAQ